MGQLTLWKGVRDATAPSAPMGCAARAPRAATSHSGRAPHTNTPLWLGPRVCGAGAHRGKSYCVITSLHAVRALRSM